MSSEKRLAPGFRQVDAFDPDDTYECDENGNVVEEVSYVTLDLGAVEPTLVPSSSTYRLIGLDTPTPFLQLSGTIFQGVHQSLLGTELLFTEDKGLDDQTRRKVTHLANTSQRIRFKQVEVRPKGAPPHESEGPSTRGKGRGARTKQKSNAVGDDNIVDLITGNVDPGDLSPPRRRGGKVKGYRRGRDESQPGPSQSQPGNVEQEVAPEGASLAPELAMES
ncbi:hypothetical protein F5888DRAFT_1806062 [Russula emetica]|nr:hypothetical protein F5888DRAFT_1806062 [Russula emetica]